MKQQYLKPEAEVFSLRFTEGLLQGSPNPTTTTTTGFTQKGVYTDDEWDIE